MNAGYQVGFAVCKGLLDHQRRVVSATHIERGLWPAAAAFGVQAGRWGAVGNFYRARFQIRCTTNHHTTMDVVQASRGSHVYTMAVDTLGLFQ